PEGGAGGFQPPVIRSARANPGPRDFLRRRPPRIPRAGVELIGCKISRFASRDAICYSRIHAPDALFRGSSVVEQPAVNRLVVGPNPTRGAIYRRSVPAESPR